MTLRGTCSLSRRQARIPGHLLGRAETAHVAQLADDHIGGHRAYARHAVQHFAGLAFGYRRLLGELPQLAIDHAQTRLTLVQFLEQSLDDEPVGWRQRKPGHVPTSRLAEQRTDICVVARHDMSQFVFYPRDPPLYEHPVSHQRPMLTLPGRRA